MKVLVIGDVILDQLIHYETTKWSNEFDYPIIKEVARSYYPGGAGFVAANCVSLGAFTTLLGNFGNNHTLRFLMEDVDIETIDCSKGYKNTTTKTRVYVDDHPTFRIDEDVYQKLDSDETLHHIYKYNYDALLLSDYQKGALTDSKLVCSIIEEFKKKNPSSVISANPKPPLVKILPKIDLLSMNRSEMAEADVIDTSWTSRADWFIRTLGSEGLDLYAYGNMKTYRTIPIEDPDVCGCGDAVFAAASLAYSNGGGFTMDILGKIVVAAGTAKAMKKGTIPISSKDILDTLKRIENGS